MSSVRRREAPADLSLEEVPASARGGDDAGEDASEVSAVPVPGAALLGVDWGSTHVRAALLDADGAALATDSLEAGVRSARGEACAQVLDLVTAEWMAQRDALPALLTGMVGSAQGWVDAPYVPCPARLEDVAAALVPAPRPGTWIVPGVSGVAVSGAPDVMRGEETQLFGLDGDGIVVLPGTHTKWAELRDGAIASFTTCMTGELFGLILDPGLVGAVVTSRTLDEAAFARGAADGEALDGGLAHHLFTVRSRTLRGDVASDAAWSYASGLLIGAEVAAMTDALDLAGGGAPVRVVGAPDVSARYAAALARKDVAVELVDVGRATAAGLMRVARAAGVFER